jgi:hypothetical protein
MIAVEPSGSVYVVVEEGTGRVEPPMTITKLEVNAEVRPEAPLDFPEADVDKPER